MSRAWFGGTCALAIVLCAPAPAHATGFTDLGDDISRHLDFAVELHGLLRARGELLYNLDLDRGPTPSGDALFPVPLSDPSGQLLTHADTRLRSDIAIYAPGGAVAIKARIDVLDNLTLGSLPNDAPSISTRQLSPDAPVKVERVWGEVLTPIGLLAVGRMGSQFGLGMVANGGDCLDCDVGDSADRIAFVTPLAGLIWAAAYDISSSGPYTARRSPNRYVDLDPADNTSTVTLAVLDYATELTRARRGRADKSTFEWGAYLTYRWQDRDVPGSYIATANPVPLTPSQSVYRGFDAYAGSVWSRLTLPFGRVEIEAAVVSATIEQATLVPGALLRDPIESLQWGAALVSDFAPFGNVVRLGFDAGVASGDPAPGFGAFPKANTPPPRPGDLDGAQATPGRDNRVDNFRFHPSYRVDRILFREIIGTVTDAIYLRPHLAGTIWSHPKGELVMGVAGIVSFAMEANSAPGGENALGVELDPTLAYTSHDGFHVSLDYAVLFPLDGLSNPVLGLAPQPAQLLRLRLGLVY